MWVMKTKEHLGPDKMAAKDRKKFFSFYKTHRSRALLGFLEDIGRNAANRKRLSGFLGKRKMVKCLVMGCSHWANPEDATNFLKSFNKNLEVNLVALDALPDALIEIVKHGVKCLPLLTPAQKTPFLDRYFDIVICDCLLTCCSFDQHEPVIKEMSRVIKKNGLVMLGVVHSDKKTTFKMAERPITNYSRPPNDYKKIFAKHNLLFPEKVSVETRLPGKWSYMKIENTIVTKEK